ncbi:MAG: ABC transporter permease [Parabacteroides sp.]|nr:ABC transporter permease [Parabacteroides sp.]
MLKHYFKVALRLIRKSFLFSSINILGFVLGVTAAFLIYLWIVDEMTFEDFQKNGDSIYRVIREEETAGGQVPSTVTPLSEEFRKRFPKVENATFIKYGGVEDFHLGDKFIEANCAFVDTTFFDVFSFPVVAGDPNLVKRDPQQIVVSEATVKKLFGETSPIGKEIYTGNKYYKIAAVLKVPRKSHIQFEALVSWEAYKAAFQGLFDDYWSFSERMHVFIQLKKGAVLTEADRLAMRNLWSEHLDKEKPLAFQPLKDIHLYTSFKEPKDVYNHGSVQQIYLFSVLAVLIIFMGAFNFMTLSTARSSQRFKEIGVRKVIGGKRKMLVTQFMAESLVQAFISLLLALALTELLLPLFNQFVGKDISLQLNWQTLLFVLFGIVGVGCLAGSFPAFYMSSFNPLLAFKGGKVTGRKEAFIKGLVCVQFAIAIVMIICTAVIFKQLHFLQNADLGLDKEHLIEVDVLDWRRGSDGFKQEILKNPHVKSMALGVDVTDYLQGYDDFEQGMFRWEDENGKIDSVKMVGMVGDGDFIPTLGLTLLKGETFGTNPDHYWDDSYAQESPIVINETAWKRLNVENPIGMLLSGGGFGIHNSRVVGIVKDFNFQPLREKIKPAFFYYTVQMFNYMYVRISAENQAETLKFLKEKYEEACPDMLFNYRFLTDILNDHYARERQQSRMFLIFTVLAVIVAMMGVFSLVSLSTVQRTKEIGIRKVNGAHSGRIVKMFCREYMIWVGIAFVVACPLGYLFMLKWLSNFAYQTAISWWLFPLAGGIIGVITLATVVAQTWRAASRNPVESLRYE